MVLPFPAAEPVGDGYDLFILRKSSRVMRPSGVRIPVGVWLLYPSLGEFEAEIDGLPRLDGGWCLSIVYSIAF